MTEDTTPVDPVTPPAPFVPTVRGHIGKPSDDTPSEAVVPRTVIIDRQVTAEGQSQLCAQFIFTGTEAEATELLAVLTAVSKVNGVRIVSAGGW